MDTAGFSSTQTIDKDAENVSFLNHKNAEVFRYKFSYRRNLWLQVLGENDAGETWNKGPDFLSFSFGVRNFRGCKMLVLGDYQLQFGQGLACWSGMGFGKSSATVSIRKTGMGIRPYSSVNESGFFRGVASTWKLKQFEVTPFISLRKKDALVEWNDDGRVISVGADQLSGYHRTAQELLSRGTVRQLITGGQIGYTRKKFSFGLLAYQEARVVANYNRMKQVYSFSVQRSLRNGMLFSEVANNGGTRASALVGVTLAVHSSFSFSAMLRNFQSQFQSIASQVLAEGNGLDPKSERGCYMGIQWQVSRRSQVNGYVDYSFFNASRYQVTGSSLVRDRLIQFTFSPDRKSQFYFRVKCKSSVEDAVSFTRIAEPLPKALLQARFNAQIQIHSEWKWHVRAEMNELFMNGELSAKGYLILNDLSWKRMNFPLSFVLRYAQFNATAWDVRSYAYENDVQYSYSIPAYYGKGSRWYILLKYQMGRKIDWWLRISNWGYVDREQIGSGITMINGDQKTECTLQVRIQF